MRRLLAILLLSPVLLLGQGRSFSPTLRANSAAPLTVAQVDGNFTGLASIANSAQRSYIAASQVAMLALSPTPQTGDSCWRSDLLASYIFVGGDATNIANWATASAVAGALTVNGKLNLAATTATTTNGDMWQDSTQFALGTYQDSLKQYISTSSAVGTASTTTSGTGAVSMLGTGTGTLTFPANFFVVGKTVRLKGVGTFTTAASPGTTTLILALGGTTVATSAAVTANASLTNAAFEFECVITCRTTGASGSVFANGMLRYAGTSNAVAAIGVTATAATTINTTTSQALTFTSTNSISSGAVFTTTNYSVEVLN